MEHPGIMKVNQAERAPAQQLWAPRWVPETFSALRSTGFFKSRGKKEKIFFFTH
jgi:hypothetical protein